MKRTLTQQKQKRYLRLGFLIAGLVFFVNPNVNLFDILPDFLGCALIIAAIPHASETLPYFSEARTRFLKLFWFSLSKLPAALLMMTIFAGDASQRSMIAIFAFVYAILELVFLLPAFRALYDGFFYLGQRFDCDAAILRDRRCNPDALPAFAVFFFFLRALGSTLPEFSLVPVTDSGASRLIQFYPFFAAGAFLIVLVPGILFAVRNIRYFRRLERDGGAERVVAQRVDACREELDRRHTILRIRIVTILLTVAVGFGIDLIFDNFNVIPDFIAGVLILIGFLAFGLRGRRDWILLAVPGVYLVSSVVSYVLSIVFFTQYDYSSLYERGGALALYSSYLTAAAVELALSIMLAVVLAVVLMRMIPLSVDSLSGGMSRQTTESRTSLRRETVVLTVISVLSSCASYAYAILMQYRKDVILDTNAAAGLQTSTDMPLLEWFWMVPLVTALIRFGIMLHLCDRLRAESEITYGDM